MVRMPPPRLLEPLSESLANTLLIEARVPSIEEYRELCGAVGWSDTINFAAAPTLLGAPKTRDSAWGGALWSGS